MEGRKAAIHPDGHPTEEKMEQSPAPIVKAVPARPVSVMDLPGDCTTQILLQAAMQGSAESTEDWGQGLAMTMLPPFGLEHVWTKVAAAPRAAMLSLVNAK